MNVTSTIHRFLRARRKDIIPLVLFLFLPVLSFPELFFRQETLYRGDLTWIHYPLRVFAAQEWLSGRIPLWNPYVLLGSPLLAEAQIGLLQPLNALFLLPLPPYRILTLFVMLHFTLAATFTYILARSLAIGRAGATLAGLSFGFGGFLMAQVTNLNVMTGAAWLPLVFCGLVWTLQSRRWTVALWSGLPLALHIFAAHPQIPLLTTSLLFGFGLYESIRLWRLSPKAPRWRDIGRVWFLLVLMFGSGLLLAAPQILPTWELQQLSVRAEGTETGQMIFSIPPVQWIALILPNVFGNPVTGFHGVRGNFEETNLYVGILPLLMVPLSWRIRRQPMIFFWWLVLLVGGLLALGDYLPLYGMLQQLPVFDLFRAPARWSVTVNLALSMLAAYGFQGLLDRPLGRRCWTALFGLWGAVVAMLLVLWIFQPSLYQWIDSFPRENDLIEAGRELLRRGLFETPEEYGRRIILETLAWWVTPAIALAVRSGVAVLLTGAYVTQRLSKPAFIIIALALVAGDLALAGGSAVNQTTQADHFEQLSESMQYIRQQKDNFSRFYTVASSDEKDVVAGLKHYFPSAYRILASGGHSPLRLHRYDLLMQQGHPLIKLSVTATRYILNDGRLGADAESVLKRVYQDDRWYVYEYPDSLPLAFVIHTAVVVESDEYALSYLRRGDYDPATLLILQTDEPVPDVSAGLSGPDKIIITSYRPNRIEIQAELADDGFLVLLDNYYPGWQAYVDGQSRPILRAYYIGRAVYLEEGEHTVRFVYCPLSFWAGVVLAGVTGLILAGAAWWTWATRQYNLFFSH